MGKNQTISRNEMTSTADHCVGLLDGLLSSLSQSDNCIASAQAVALFDEKTTAVIDVREATCQKNFKPVPGTYRIAFNEENFIERFLVNDFGLENFDKITDFIFVCSYGLRSQNVASRLEQTGMENVYHLCGGLEALEKNEAPLKKAA